MTNDDDNDPDNDATGPVAKPGKVPKRPKRPKLLEHEFPEIVVGWQAAQLFGVSEWTFSRRKDEWGAKRIEQSSERKPKYVTAQLRALRDKRRAEKAAKTAGIEQLVTPPPGPPMASPVSTLASSMPQGHQPASDVPFRYQPGSAVRAGRRVAPGFEHCTLDEYERNEKELRASGKLYDD